MDRFINTPVGQFKMPSDISTWLDSLDDIGLIEAYFERSKNFIDPFIYQEMSNRGLVFKDEHTADIEVRLAKLISKRDFTPDSFLNWIDAESKAIEYNFQNDINNPNYIFKKELYEALYNSDIPNEILPALNRKDSILEDIYNFCHEHEGSDKIPDVIVIVEDYLNEIEKDFLLEKLKDKLIACRDERFAEIKMMKSYEVMQHANEITDLQEIVDFNYADFETEQIRSLLSFDNLTHLISSLWKESDVELEDVILHVADDIREAMREIEKAEQELVPTKDDLIEKIDMELKTFEQSTTADKRDENFFSEMEIKTYFCNALYNTPLSDNMVKLFINKSDILHELYDFSVGKDYFRDSSDTLQGSIYQATMDFLDKQNHDYIANRLYDCVHLEYEEYVDMVKKLPPDKIIDEAYKLTILYDIQCSLDPNISDISTEQLKVLMSLDSPLWCLYNEWQCRDITRMDDINDVITETADETAKKSEVNEFGTNSYQSSDPNIDVENDDEQEL